MEIKFLLQDIDDLNKIYNTYEEHSEDFGVYTKTDYVAKDYYDLCLNCLKTNCCEINNITHNGCLERVANEVYIIETDIAKYTISFTLDTYENHNQVTVRIARDDNSVDYDLILEKMKIQLKNILIKDWKICVWVIDQQSTELAVKLYKILYETENHIRAFVNRVMTAKFGVKWFEFTEFKKVKDDYLKTIKDFKRTVPCFNNINDILLSLTIDTLIDIMLEIKIYERTFTLPLEEQQKIVEKVILNNNNSIFEHVRQCLSLKYDLWRDIFSPLFVNCTEIEKELREIIKNRNHIAHNKLIDRSAYDKIEKNIKTVKGYIVKAENKFDENVVSNELYETWEAIEESERENKEYINQRIEDETGIIIRNEREIFKLFCESIYKIYMEICDGEYFNNSIDVSDYKDPEDMQNEQRVFSIKSNVKDEYNFDVFVQFDITEGQGESSNMYITARNERNTILDATVQYSNGEAHEDYMECIYVPDSESEIDEDAIKEFAIDLVDYIKEEMNELKSEIDSMRYSAVKDGAGLPLANIPCWNCYQEYISLDDDIYPYGKCINCGEDNEIKTCGRCGSIYDADEGDGFLCGYCLDKFEFE